MKLYVALTQMDHEGGYLHGVFATPEQANAALTEVREAGHSADAFEVVEMELNEFLQGGISV